MSGVFKEGIYGHMSEELEWLLDVARTETASEVLSYFDSEAPAQVIEEWQRDGKKAWRVEAIKNGHRRRIALLAASLEQRSNSGMFILERIESIRDACKDAASLYGSASEEEIAEALWTLADVLDISVPQKQAEFIISRIRETLLPLPAVWWLCRTIAKKEKGRFLKPAVFEPYLQCAEDRRWDLIKIVSTYALIHAEFDAILAECLTIEPSLITEEPYHVGV